MLIEPGVVGFTPTRRNLLQIAGLLGVALVAPSAGAAFRPVFSKSQLAMLGDVAEVIIPATNTGGAKAAGVPAFIEMMVGQWFDPAERANFLAGMKAFSDDVTARHGKPFGRLTAEQQDAYFGALLAAEESKPQQARGIIPKPGAPDRPRSPFVVLMKRLTVMGYYTSELGASVELTFNMGSDEHSGCEPVKPGEAAGSYSIFAFAPFSAH